MISEDMERVERLEHLKKMLAKVIAKFLIEDPSQLRGCLPDYYALEWAIAELGHRERQGA